MKMSDRRAETMENAIVFALSAFPPQLVKTITTCDRGTEVASWRRIEERIARSILPTHVYLAEGTNESEQPARFYPKGRNLSVLLPPH